MKKWCGIDGRRYHFTLYHVIKKKGLAFSTSMRNVVLQHVETVMGARTTLHLIDKYNLTGEDNENE